MPFPEPNRHFTYADYAAWDGPERYELIRGEPVLMSGPSTAHQRISRKILVRVDQYLEGKPCEVFHAPFDVCLNGLDTEDDTVVQPDVLVVCDPSKLNSKGCNGAPDLVVEILSPSSRRHDQFTKYQLYRDAGVSEYWLVDPEAEIVQIHTLAAKGYLTSIYGEGKAPSQVLPGFELSLTEVFESPGE